jgi:hypothetical protein
MQIEPRMQMRTAASPKAWKLTKGQTTQNPWKKETFRRRAIKGFSKEIHQTQRLDGMCLRNLRSQHAREIIGEAENNFDNK